MSGCHAVLVIRAHIIVSLITPVFILLHGNGEVNRQGLQHQLVRPCGVGVANNDILAGSSGSHTVRYDPVIGKITASDHITGP